MPVSLALDIWRSLARSPFATPIQIQTAARQQVSRWLRSQRRLFRSVPSVCALAGQSAYSADCRCVGARDLATWSYSSHTQTHALKHNGKRPAIELCGRPGESAPITRRPAIRPAPTGRSGPSMSRRQMAREPCERRTIGGGFLEPPRGGQKYLPTFVVVSLLRLPLSRLCGFKSPKSISNPLVNAPPCQRSCWRVARSVCLL